MDGDFEHLLQQAGALGLWQVRLFFFIALNGFFMAFQHLGAVFLAASPDHWCKVDSESTNFSTFSPEEIKALTIPIESRNGENRFSQCYYFDRNYSAFNLPVNGSNFTEKAELKACDAWEYDKSQYISTIVTEWDLVCSFTWLKSSVQGSYMAGVLVGCLVFGFVSDRWGRRKAILIAQVIFCSASIATSFAPYYDAFMIGRFLIATSAPGIFACSFVFMTEIVDTRRRSIIGVYYQIPFGLGYAALPALAYFIRDWSNLQLAMSLPSLVILLSYWLIPESPRWLITKNRLNEAIAVLRQCAKVNKHTLQSDEELLRIMREMQKKEEIATNENSVNKRILITKLCSSREMFKRTLAAYFTWFVVAMVYYGLALNSPTLGGNPYVVVFLGGILEVPAYLIGSLVVSWHGRKIPYSLSFILAGAVCFLILFVPTSITWLISTLAVMGKFLITITFAISYLYTAELFPTTVRNIAVSYGSMVSRIGSISAPYIVDLLDYHHQTIPLILFGIVSTLAGIISLLLPETKNVQMKFNNGTVNPKCRNVEMENGKSDESHLHPLTNNINNATDD